MTWIVESDDWGPGPSIAAEDTLARIRSVLEKSPVIVEHWFYRGSRAPERVVFDDYDDFTQYLERGSRAGDIFQVWQYDELCRDDNVIARAKLPDALGRVPKHGPY